MEAHFQGAKALSAGDKWDGLAGYGVRFKKISIDTIGYFLYAEVLSWLIFRATILSVGMNVYLVYIIQSVIMIDALVRFSQAFAIILNKKRISGIFLCLALCVTYAITAYQLLRDSILMWLIAVLLKYVVDAGKKQAQGKIGIDEKYIVATFLVLMCFVFRIYSILITVPLVCYYYGYKKTALGMSLSFAGILALGTAIIQIVRQFTSISWAFGTVEAAETLQFILFPNIFNQTKYLTNWDFYFFDYNYSSGCNVPGVYYLMSIWNVAVIPLAGMGVFNKFRKFGKENTLWLMILLNTAMLYSLSYSVIDTRQKLFMSLPLCFLACRGYDWLEALDKTARFSYFICVLMVVTGAYLLV